MLNVCKIIIIALLSICNVWTVGSTKYPVVPFQPNVAALFFKTQLAKQNPEQAMLCFGQYMQNSNTINEQYSTDYNQCLLETKSQREQLNVEMNENKTKIVAASAAVCQRLSACNELSSPLDTFQCHSQEGAVNSKDVYIISANASDYFTVLQEQYRLIEVHQDHCIKAAERTYVTETAINYNQLQECLDGKEVAKPTVPTQLPTDTATESYETSTEIVNVTTDEVTIQSPEGKSYKAPLAKFLNLFKEGLFIKAKMFLAKRQKKADNISKQSEEDTLTELFNLFK